MHALLVANQGYLSEEETWDLGEVKGEFIGHKLGLSTKVLKKIAYSQSSFTLTTIVQV